MQLTRRIVAADPRLFGRGPQRRLNDEPVAESSALGADAKLFVTTFLAGFIFVSVLIA
jgi:hypothetical protein